MKNIYLKTIVSIILFLVIRVFLASATSGDATAIANNFILLDNFDARLNGNIHNQGDWIANEPGAAAGSIVVADPPTYFSDKALQNDPRETLSRGNAYLPFGANEISDGSSGTLFLQVSLQDHAQSNFSVGLSSSSTPNIFSNAGVDDFSVEVNLGSEGLRVRNGANYEIVSNITLQSDKLYSVWLAVDNVNDTFQLWVDGNTNSATEPVKAVTASGDTFAFRQPLSEPLRAFTIQNIGLNSGVSFIDNLSIQPNGVDLTNPGTNFVLVDNFETLNSGALGNSNGWQSSGNVAVVVDPNGSSNQVVSLQNENVTAFKAVENELNEGDTGTLYFRMMRQQSIDAFGGLSDEADPADWSAFETQTGINNLDLNKFAVRDGTEFRVSDSEFIENRWYCAWVVTDNAADSYEVYLRGGQFATITRLLAEQLSTFGFRNGTAANPLRTFYVRTGTDRGGIFYVDDVYLDNNSQNFSDPSASCGDQTSPTPTATPNGTTVPAATPTPNVGPTLDPNQPLDDPIPQRIERDGSTVQFQTIATVPQSATGEILPRTNPRTRLNFLFHSRDGSGRLFANDLRGQLYVINPDNGQVDLYLNIKPKFSNWLESPGLNSGFSTFTFHPEFAENGLFYTIHTEEPNGTPDYRTLNPEPIVAHGVLVEWRADDSSSNVFSGTHRELLRIAQASTAHGMQQAQFRPHANSGDDDYGMLYVSNGDGENSPHFSDAAQNLGSLQGTVFRIDPAGNNSPNGKYGIPMSNPYVDSGDAAILKEIYAYGFRNPNRFTWDVASNNKILLANIGQNNIDEVELVEPTRNYGWNEREGTFRFDTNNPSNVYPLPIDDAVNGYTYPVAQYDHDEGYAIQGGFVYRGSLMPEMQGVYIFGDIVLGHLFYVHVDNLIFGSQAQIHKLILLNENGNAVDFKPLVDSSNQRADLRFGLDEQGEIYIMSKQDGVIRRLVSGDLANPTPTPTTTIETPTPPSLPATDIPTSTPIQTATTVPSNTPEGSTPTATQAQVTLTAAPSTAIPSATLPSSTPTPPSATPSATVNSMPTAPASSTPLPGTPNPSETPTSVTPNSSAPTASTNTPSPAETAIPNSTPTPTPSSVQLDSIGGTIWCDLDADNMMGESEGISNAEIQLIGPDDLIVDTPTDVSGAYRFKQLASGIYTVRINHIPNFCNQSLYEPDETLDRLTTVNLARGESVLNIDFVFAPRPETLADIVWHDLDSNGIQDAGEVGIGGVVVQLYDKENMLQHETITDEKGEYDIPNIVPTHEYYMVFTLPQDWQFATIDPLDQSIQIDMGTGRTAMFSIDGDGVAKRFAVSALPVGGVFEQEQGIYLPAMIR